MGAHPAAKNIFTIGASDSARPNVDGKYNPVADSRFIVQVSATLGQQQMVASNLTWLRCAILSARAQTILPALQANSVQKYGQVPANLGLGDQYAFSWGTSMATPLVARCAAVIREVLVKHVQITLDTSILDISIY